MTSGKCVLFVGAGISAGAGLPGWQELIEKLKDELSCQTDADWLTIAQAYQQRFEKEALERKLQVLTGTDGKHLTKVHKLLPSLRIDVWVTTNYDNFLERVLATTGQSFCVVVQDIDLPNINPHDKILVKLHGDTCRPGTMILTKNDFFLSQQTRDLIWKKMSIYLAERSFLFLGYGVNDPDLSQIQASLVYQLGKNRVRPSYAVMTTKLDEIRLADLASRNIRVIDLSGSGFPDPTEAVYWFLNRVIDRIRRYPSISPEYHRAKAANTLIPIDAKNEIETLGYRLILCIEYRVYCQYLDGGQFTTVPREWQPPLPVKLRQSKYPTVRYRRSDSGYENIWEGIAVGRKKAQRVDAANRP